MRSHSDRGRAQGPPVSDLRDTDPAPRNLLTTNLPSLPHQSLIFPLIPDPALGQAEWGQLVSVRLGCFEITDGLTPIHRVTVVITESNLTEQLIASLVSVLWLASPRCPEHLYNPPTCL